MVESALGVTVVEDESGDAAITQDLLNNATELHDQDFENDPNFPFGNFAGITSSVFAVLYPVGDFLTGGPLIEVIQSFPIADNVYFISLIRALYGFSTFMLGAQIATGRGL